MNVDIYMSDKREVGRKRQDKGRERGERYRKEKREEQREEREKEGDREQQTLTTNCSVLFS